MCVRGSWYVVFSIYRGFWSHWAGPFNTKGEAIKARGSKSARVFRA